MVDKVPLLPLRPNRSRQVHPAVKVGSSTRFSERECHPFVQERMAERDQRNAERSAKQTPRKLKLGQAMSGHDQRIRELASSLEIEVRSVPDFPAWCQLIMPSRITPAGPNMKVDDEVVEAALKAARAWTEVAERSPVQQRLAFLAIGVRPTSGIYAPATTAARQLFEHWPDVAEGCLGGKLGEELIALAVAGRMKQDRTTRGVLL